MKCCKCCHFLVFVQLFEKYGTSVERNTALIEKVSSFRALLRREEAAVQDRLEREQFDEKRRWARRLEMRQKIADPEWRPWRLAARKQKQRQQLSSAHEAATLPADDEDVHRQNVDDAIPEAATLPADDEDVHRQNVDDAIPEAATLPADDEDVHRQNVDDAIPVAVDDPAQDE
eukprot:SAG31_NODE_2508_length_5589_cov_11.540073_4_plen_174_part_00